MGPTALPPTPPAIIRTLADFARQQLGRGAEDAVTLGDVQDAVASITTSEGGPTVQEPYRRPFYFGRKTKGRRDASLRCRANRRKS